MRQLILTLVLLFSIISASLFGQMPPDEFFKGMKIMDKNEVKAKRLFQIAIEKDESFYGSYHFLGVMLYNESKIDSAIINYKKSIKLNLDNVNHTREMTYVRLINAYLINNDFENSFSNAWDAFLKYPDSRSINRELKDVCLWSFYVNHNGLDSSYLSSQIKDEYIVNSIPEEYLIIRRLRVDNHYLSVKSQALKNKKGKNYDIITCEISKSTKKVDVKFQLNWDLNKDYSGNVVNTSSIISDTEFPIYERIGALLVSDSDIDLKDEIEKMKLAKEEL